MTTPAYATPHHFQRLTAPLLPWLAAASALLLAVATYLGLWHAPVDYQQGAFVRMIYLHVPAAWLSLGLYLVMGLASLAYLVWKNPLADRLAREIAPVGAGFTTICLVTGMLWAKPMWGAWWVWDARLTSMLLLWFLYLGYLMLLQVMESSPARASHSAAVLAVLGLVNLPVVKFSVDWWNSLHQPASVFRTDGSQIHAAIQQPLLLMFLAQAVCAAMLILLGMQGTAAAARLKRQKMALRKL